MKYLKLLGIIVFIYILTLLNYKVVIQTIINLKIEFLILYVITFFVFFVFKIYRWHIIQNYFSKPLKFKENFWIFLETIYLSYVTPGKIGDIARIWIMKEHFNIEKKETMIAYIFDRVQDLLFLIICVLYGLFFILNIQISNYIYIGLIIFIILYIFKNRVLNLFKNRFNIEKNIQTNLNFEIKVFIFNIISYFFYFLQLYFLAKAMNLNIEYSFIVALVSISAIATIIPISIGGLGVREGVFVFLLASIGISKEKAVLLSLLDNVVFLAIFIVFLHLCSKLYFSLRPL